MSRRRWALLVLGLMGFVTAKWVYPWLTPRAVHLRVAEIECAQFVSVEVLQGDALLRRLQVSPASTGLSLSYDTTLHAGEYDIVVEVVCATGGVERGRRRSIVITDEATYYLRPPATCECR